VPNMPGAETLTSPQTLKNAPLPFIMAIAN